MYKLKQMAKRGSALVGAVGLLAGITSSALPSLVSADSLNPLTERSLTLSSSSPGWAYTDGSGNSTYAGPNTGTNGQKTGNTFTFRTSSTKTIKAFTFQYCTSAAGLCGAPGNNTAEVYDPASISANPSNPSLWTFTTPRGSDDTSSHSDLNIVRDGATSSEVTGTGYQTLTADSNALATGSGNSGGGTSDTEDASYGDVAQVPDAQDTVSPYDYSHQHGTDQSNGVSGNFVVLYGSSATGYVNQYSGSWSMAVSNQEEATINPDGTTNRTGKNNLITLTNSGSGIALAPGDYVKIIFFGTDKNYITNPGAGAFFVKINDFDQTTNVNPVTDASYVIDGGVTVANVMNQSIQIQTKVLETMDFSVGTVDPDTLTDTELQTASAGEITGAGQCNRILTTLHPEDPSNYPADSLIMGNSDAENSLDTTHTYATHSYWRLSSNSSGGATIYYAGNTLSNTEGDKIAAIGTTATAPNPGTEQFGLALDNGTTGTHDVDYSWATAQSGPPAIALEAGADYNSGTHGQTLSSDWTTYQGTHSALAHNPRLAPLVPLTGYGQGTGGINSIDSGGISTHFSFDANSQTVPTPIASENTQVVDCVTGKMRYIANIAATTPAGIYTTKINYIAAPQY